VTWIKLLQFVLGVASKLAGYVKDKQLIDAGRAEAAYDQLRGAQNAIERGLAARRKPDGVLGDKYDRDTKG